MIEYIMSMANTKNKNSKYELWLGSFEGENFKWKKINEWKDKKVAYDEFTRFVSKQIEYSDEELFKVWESTRLDIELEYNGKTLKWFGISFRLDTNIKNDSLNFGPRVN